MTSPSQTDFSTFMSVSLPKTPSKPYAARVAFLA